MKTNLTAKYCSHWLAWLGVPFDASSFSRQWAQPVLCRGSIKQYNQKFQLERPYDSNLWLIAEAPFLSGCFKTRKRGNHLGIFQWSFFPTISVYHPVWSGGHVIIIKSNLIGSELKMVHHGIDGIGASCTKYSCLCQTCLA